MAQQKSTTKTQSKNNPLKKETQRSYTIDFIPAKWQTPVFLAVILILIMIFFNAGLFGGKVFSSADNVASGSFKTFLDDAKAKGEFPLWVPYIFNGMPSFAALVPHLERTYDLSHAVWVYSRDAIYMLFSGNEVWSIVFFYIIFAFSFYFLIYYKFKDKLIALYAAIAVNLQARAKVAPQDVYIFTHENDYSDWSTGEGQFAMALVQQPGSAVNAVGTS